MPPTANSRGGIDHQERCSGTAHSDLFIQTVLVTAPEELRYPEDLFEGVDLRMLLHEIGGPLSFSSCLVDVPFKSIADPVAICY